jgi:drug/metabolite transporter (DMT)-like permease
MEQWIIYAGIAAILIAGRDLFTKKFSKKYSHIEHLLYYYVLCGFFIISLAIYKTQVKGEKIKIIDSEDLWKYAMVAGISAIIISPCQVLAMTNCDNPGKSASIVNLNAILSFLVASYFISGAKLEMKTFIGIAFTALGIYLII